MHLGDQDVLIPKFAGVLDTGPTRGAMRFAPWSNVSAPHCGYCKLTRVSLTWTLASRIGHLSENAGKRWGFLKYGIRKTHDTALAYLISSFACRLVRPNLDNRILLQLFGPWTGPPHRE